MKWVLIVAVCFASAGARAAFDDDAEHRFRPEYAGRATGVLGTRVKKHPWPVSVLSIGHTIASYQKYDRSPYGAYFHHGLDIRANAGSTVTACAGGKVINIQNYEPGIDAYWEIAVQDDDGFIWQYHHIDQHSIPQAIHDAYASGAPIAEGAKLGEVFYWPEVSFGERYHHVHVNVLGKGSAYVDPFALLEPLPDHDGPRFVEIGLLKNGKKISGTQVTGQYSLYAHVTDLILHQKFVVPPYLLTLEIDGKPPVTVWQFDSLPGGSSDTDFVEKFFVPSMVCGNYVCRKPVIDLGFSVSGRPIFPVDKGNHQVKVTARDQAGNSADKEFSWTVN